MRLLLATLGVTLLVGCGGPAPTTALAPGPPSSGVPTSTSEPTSTPAPTAAPTSTVAPTAEPTSTATPVSGEAQAEIDGFGYLPEPVKVRVGGTVTWTNLDLTLHSATADDGSFNSGLLSQGQTFAHTFTQPGEFSYYCTRHGGMVGRVIVTP